MGLITEFGRYNRASIVERAEAIHETGAPWSECMSTAYREASAELLARETLPAFLQTIPISRSQP